MLRNRLAKIVATLGPETGSAEAMRSLYEAGADVFRINAAYSDDAANAALVRLVQDTIADPSDPVGTLWDLPGLKMRIGGFADGAVALEPGGTFTLDQSPEPGDEHRVYLPFPEAFAHSRVGDLLRLDDGRLTLRVTEVTLYRLTTEVVAGGVLSANKAILFPNVPVPTAEVSARDADSLTAALEAGVDWVAATANGSLAVVQDFRRRVGDRAKLMIKIDSQALLDQLDAVLELVDGLFLARGDLGSSIPVERIPNAQKDCILAARRAGKPVVVAAQMLGPVNHQQSDHAAVDKGFRESHEQHETDPGRDGAGPQCLGGTEYQHIAEMSDTGGDRRAQEGTAEDEGKRIPR